MTKRSTSFFVLIIIAILLVMFLIVGQTLSVFNYELAVSLGLQESFEEVGGVGVAFAKGFGFGDTVIYLPLLIGGIWGMLRKKKWGRYAMFGSLAISVYWPLVHLYAITVGQNDLNLSQEKMLSFWVILSLIIVYGLWGMRWVYKDGKKQ